MRSLPAAAVLLTLCSGTAAVAGEYTIAYGIEALGKQEVGVLTNCTSRRVCSVRFGDIIFNIIVPGFADDSISVSVWPKNGCCYFRVAEERTTIDARESFHRLPLFFGKKRKGNEVVQNTAVGSLQLGLSPVR